VTAPGLPAYLSGKYKVHSVLGEGRLGVVYRAVELARDRSVALKVLHERYVAQSEFLARYTREAKQHVKLQHAGLVHVLSVDVERSRPVLVMEFVDGELLSTKLWKTGRLAERQVMPLLAQLSSALDFLHSRGAVHRAVRAGNVMVSAAGDATLLDFGFSGAIDEARTMAPEGAPSCLAPEQAVGSPGDHRADVFALGLLALELATGDVALRDADAADGYAAFYERIDSARLALPFLSPSVQTAIRRALEPDPALRFDSAGAFYEAFVQALAVDPTAEVPSDSLEARRALDAEQRAKAAKSAALKELSDRARLIARTRG
jgi:serine/threonine-protein kinase